jgi:hypothetical protein
MRSFDLGRSLVARLKISLKIGGITWSKAAAMSSIRATCSFPSSLPTR